VNELIDDEMRTFRVAATGIMPVQVTFQSVPSTADSDHYMIAQYLHRRTASAPSIFLSA